MLYDNQENDFYYMDCFEMIVDIIVDYTLAKESMRSPIAKFATQSEAEVYDCSR